MKDAIRSSRGDCLVYCRKCIWSPHAKGRYWKTFHPQRFINRHRRAYGHEAVLISVNGVRLEDDPQTVAYFLKDRQQKKKWSNSKMTAQVTVKPQK